MLTHVESKALPASYNQLILIKHKMVDVYWIILHIYCSIFNTCGWTPDKI